MTDTYTQADLDRIVKEAVDYASQAAAQEARAAALQEAAEWHKEVITHDRGGLDYASAVGIPISNADDLRASVAIHEYALNRILALLDTPAAEALERVRQGEREACAKVADTCQRQNGPLSKRGFNEHYRAGWEAGAQAIAAAIRHGSTITHKERRGYAP